MSSAMNAAYSTQTEQDPLTEGCMLGQVGNLLLVYESTYSIDTLAWSIPFSQVFAVTSVSHFAINGRKPPVRIMHHAQIVRQEFLKREIRAATTAPANLAIAACIG